MTVMRTFVIVGVSLVLLVWGTYAPPFTGACDSCGRECQSACGTKGFRTCCLNYLKKRSALLPSGPGMKLELMMPLRRTESGRGNSDWRYMQVRAQEEVLPELAQYYSSLKSLEPHKSQENEYKMLYEKLQSDFDRLDQVNYSEPE